MMADAGVLFFESNHATQFGSSVWPSSLVFSGLLHAAAAQRVKVS
jgi:hypothetical protein